MGQGHWFSLTACAMAATPGVCFAADFEVRITERTGQSVVTPSDPTLEFAVQIRARQGLLLGYYGFDMRMPGEADSRGVLTRARISNFDGTYSDSYAPNSTVGLGGLARQFAYLGSLNSAFNGVINSSSATFTNGPDQEIGLVSGRSANFWLTGVPGIDVDGDGHPDTWSGNGTTQSPNGGTATVAPSARGPYFAEGQFIDVYRFRYTVTDFLTARSLRVELSNVQVDAFSTLVNAQDLWGYITFPATHTATPITVSIVPTPSAALGILAATPFVLTRRRSN